MSKRLFISTMILVGLAGLTIGKSNDIPFGGALEAAAVVQNPMAAEIPGSMILGNGDLNGILWVSKGRLRFTITKNDACDGRLVTENDPNLCTIDVKNRKWNVEPGAGFPPSWATPHPTPLICGHVDFSGGGVKTPLSSWLTLRQEGTSSMTYDETAKVISTEIKGNAGNSAGWGFVPTKTKNIKRITAKLSGGANAKWYFDFPGAGVSSGWQPAAKEATEVTFDIPEGKSLARIDLYVWTNDGKPAAIRVHSISVDDEIQPLGRIELPNKTAGMNAKLDIARAVGTVTELDNNKRTIKARVLAERNVAVFQAEGPIEFIPTANRYTPGYWSKPADESELDKPRFIPEAKSGVTGKTKWFLTTVPGDVDWKGMTFAAAFASKGKEHAVAVVTSFESKDPVSAAVKLANKVLAENKNTQITRHEKAWEEFWSKSGVSMEDEYLQSVWYRNLYFLRCFSKPGVPPVGLFLGCATEVMPWHGVATTDYNFEQCFWPAFVTNHAELAEPYNRFMVDYIPRGKWFAKETYGVNGVYYPVNHFNHQINDPEICKSKNGHMNFYFPYSYLFAHNGWQAHNVWLAYLHAPDKEFLKSDAYPLIKEMAIFYKEILDQCKRTPEGKAIYGPTYSPEHRSFGVDNTPCDIAFTRFTFKAAIQSAETLECDADLVKQWKASLALVPDYPIVPDSNPPIISDILGGQPITYNVAVPAIPVFPAGEVNFFSPEDVKKRFADTIETISWTGYNSSMILSGARARLSMPGTHKWITDTFKQRQMPNGFLQLLGDTSGNFSEQVAAAGIVSEMLMQSVGGIVRVFPAWPSDSDAQFERLLAEGGFEISGVQENGKVKSIRVKAIHAGQFRLLSPWEKPVAKLKGKNIDIQPDENGIITIAMKRGDVIEFFSVK